MILRCGTGGRIEGGKGEGIFVLSKILDLDVEQKYNEINLEIWIRLFILH